jgi:hypothetical protein
LTNQRWTVPERGGRHEVSLGHSASQGCHLTGIPSTVPHGLSTRHRFRIEEALTARHRTPRHKPSPRNCMALVVGELGRKVRIQRQWTLTQG